MLTLWTEDAYGGRITSTDSLATVSYPDGSPTVNVILFARDSMSPFVNLG